jgi:hypothetical protein
MAPSAVKGVAKALRSFLRFGEFRGEVSAGLVAGVPSVYSTWPSLSGFGIAMAWPGKYLL